MNSFYENCIEKALNYISDNLNRRINLTAISEASGLSKFHFHRVFRAFTGTAVFETVERMRTQKAAELLLSSSKTIAAVAKESGFRNTESLGTEFRELYGMSPTAWRKKNRGKDGLKKAAAGMKKNEEAEAENEVTELSSELKTLDDFSIAYIRHTGAYAGDSALFIYLYNKLTSWAASKNILNADRLTVVIYHHPVRITEDSKTKISIGFSVPEDIETGGDIGRMKLRGGEYLISRFSLRDEQYETAWNRVYRELIPKLGLVPDDGFAFEIYPSDAKSEDRYASIVDICIPVTRN